MENEYMNNQYIWGVVNSIIKNPTTKIKFDVQDMEIRYIVEQFRTTSNDNTAFSTKQLYDIVVKSVNGK
jgi:hypothetical protein